MAAIFNGNGIDTDRVEDSGGACLPAGTYPVRITGTEVKPTKAGDGVIMIVEFTVDEGPGAGRKIWENLNIKNPNATAQKIGQGMLKNIVRATGAPSVITDSNQLHGMLCTISTKVVSDSFGDKAQVNSVKAYANPAPPQQGGAPQQQQPQGGATQQQGPADGGMPWNQ